MNALRTGLLLLALAATQKDQSEDAARRRFDELMTGCAHAAALDYTCELKQAMGEGDERTEVHLGAEGHVAWPARGRIRLHMLPAGGDDAAGQTVSSLPELIGDGEKVYLLDAGTKTYQDLGATWPTLFPQCGPTQAFQLRSVPDVSSVAEVTGEAAHAGLAGLRCDFGDGHVETLWSDAKGNLREVEADIASAQVHQQVTFTSWKLSSEVAPEAAATYAAALPEGYTAAPSDPMADFEADLVPVGEPAPDVELIGMDDQTFRLSSLRGKTLLVNFWFYH